MTGFARVKKNLAEGEVLVSVKSVNHRGLDLHFHVPQEMETLSRSIGREPMQRDTLYRPVPEERRAASMIAADLEPIVLTPPRKKAAVR